VSVYDLGCGTEPSTQYIQSLDQQQLGALIAQFQLAVEQNGTSLAEVVRAVTAPLTTLVRSNVKALNTVSKEVAQSVSSVIQSNTQQLVSTLQHLDENIQDIRTVNTNTLSALTSILTTGKANQTTSGECCPQITINVNEAQASAFTGAVTQRQQGPAVNVAPVISGGPGSLGTVAAAGPGASASAGLVPGGGVAGGPVGHSFGGSSPSVAPGQVGGSALPQGVAGGPVLAVVNGPLNVQIQNEYAGLLALQSEIFHRLSVLSETESGATVVAPAEPAAAGVSGPVSSASAGAVGEGGAAAALVAQGANGSAPLGSAAPTLANYQYVYVYAPVGSAGPTSVVDNTDLVQLANLASSGYQMVQSFPVSAGWTVQLVQQLYGSFGGAGSPSFLGPLVAAPGLVTPAPTAAPGSTSAGAGTPALGVGGIVSASALSGATAAGMPGQYLLSGETLPIAAQPVAAPASAAAPTTAAAPAPSGSPPVDWQTQPTDWLLGPWDADWKVRAYSYYGPTFAAVSTAESWPAAADALLSAEQTVSTPGPNGI
jgi:hypothetical protein